MKKLSVFIMLLIAVVIYSCKSNSLVGPGGGFGNVTVTPSLVQDPNGAYFFQFVPSVSVTVDSIRATCTQININAVIPGDGTTVYTTTEPVGVPLGQTPVATGQQWNFIAYGKQGTSTGTIYRTNINYTIP